MPRLLLGQIMVITTNRSAVNNGVGLLPLAPTSGNLTQACYAIGGLCAFMAMRSMLQHADGPAMFRRAMLVLASLNILAALINLGEQATGLTGFLALIHNANYATIEGGEVGGLIRIAGTFPEASAFAGFTVPIFAFMLSLYRSGVSRPLTGWLALVSFALLAISTSTTAYGALLLYFACLAGAAVWRALWNGVDPGLGVLALIFWIALVAVCFVLLLSPSVMGAVSDFFQITVVRKLESSSGIERSSWNAQAWSNFIESYGLGVGMGSARASSFPMVLLSNLGLVGAVLFAVFVFNVLGNAFAASADKRHPVSLAAGHAVLASLLTISISGTVFDLGMAFYTFSAVASVGRREPAVQPSSLAGRAAHV
jgi:hypothetical protein